MLRTYLRINRVGLVGAARLSPERTGKVGTAARPGSGDAVGRAAPDLLLVRLLLLKSCRRGRQIAGEAGGWGRVEIGSAQQNRGESGPGTTQNHRVGQPTVGTL